MAAFDATLAGLGLNRYAAGAATDTSNLGKTEMDQSDFLRLMTAQLKNQDPFAPVDNTQMVAQMAQFSSLAGISEMNTTLKSLAEKLSAGSLGDAIGYVGRSVLVEGATAYPRTQGGIAGAVALSADAEDVRVVIRDADGAALAALSLGKQAAGAVAFDWDGTTESGAPAGDGPFTVEVIATGAAGSVTAAPLVWAPVSSVSLGADGKPLLALPGLGQLPLDAVWQVG